MVILNVIYAVLPASDEYFRLWITFSSSLDPVEARQNARPDLDPESLY